MPRPILLGALLSLLLSGPLTADGVWLQWGGPGRDFHAPAAGLAPGWPEDGPRLLWQRRIGDDGHSALLADGPRLYTMARRGDDETVLCLDAATGESVWETSYPAPVAEDMVLDHGLGPHATPAIAGDRLFSVGLTVRLHALDRASGEILWSHDLMAEMGASHMLRGYGPSPLVYGDLVIVTPGGAGQAVAAFRQADGEKVWKGQSGTPSYSSPIVARIGGEDQVVVALGADRLGLDPRTGELRWRLRLPRESANLMSTQLWSEEDGLLFASAAYADGSRAVAVAKKNGHFEAEERWFSPKMRVQHGTVVRVGDLVYGSSGDFGPAFLTAVDLATGELAFRQRGFSKANLVAAGARLIILDEDGYLALGTPSPGGIEIHSRAQVLEPVTWTVPTVVGSRLFVRNRTHVKAFDLGLPDSSAAP